MPKILVAHEEEDQEELITHRFAHKDYLRDYEFIFARDGPQALKLVKERYNSSNAEVVNSYQLI